MSQIQRSEITDRGLTSSYLFAGDPSATPVVLLHDGAWGGSAEGSWNGVIPHLARDRYVIAPDLYGYGLSSKMVQLDVAPFEFRLHQVAGLLDALGLGARTAHFIGNSFGGAMAFRGSTLPWFSWRMRSAVSIAGTGGPYRTRDSLVELARFDGTREDIGRIVRLMTGEFPGIDEHIDLRLRYARTNGHFRSVAAAGLETPFPSAREADPYPENLAAVDIPLVAIAGREDTLLEPQWGERVVLHAPLGRIVEIPGRHSPNVSDPERTAEVLREVLDENERLCLKA